MDELTKPVAGEPINLVIAADDKYSMPLATTVRSVIDTLKNNARLDVYVLDGGISDRNKHRIIRSWPSRQLNVHWLSPDREPIRDLQTCGYLSLTAYLRLFIGELLPSSVRKAIYLDSDVIVRRDLSEMWSTPCDDVPCCAVPDLLTPYLNTREAIGRSTLCDRQSHFTLPIKNYRELGLPGNAAYFNSGVLLINVDHWRRNSFLQSALRCLREHHDYVHLGDQYALNILFSGQWRHLDLRWNQIGTVYDCVEPSDFPFDQSLLQPVIDSPWIVHYCWRDKPWLASCNHPQNYPE